jgi:hypothetical protein
MQLRIHVVVDSENTMVKKNRNILVVSKLLFINKKGEYGFDVSPKFDLIIKVVSTIPR